ncbi:MAG: type II toxin-antitoxin system PemK/MazF family toxin [Thermodesulfobacteriota bacterium]|nr:type II toxin-antitoxin system PemK/MazF family toxin [Thermodesulfobacteriota bacterium]
MIRKKYIPQRGDIVWTNFNPASGHEQMGKRPALVLSPTPFNKKIKLAMVAPITSRVRGHGFEVALNGKKVKGVVLCQQVKMIDYTARGIQFVEKAMSAVTSDALAKVRTIVSD